MDASEVFGFLSLEVIKVGTVGGTTNFKVVSQNRLMSAMHMRRFLYKSLF